MDEGKLICAGLAKVYCLAETNNTCVIFHALWK